MLKDRKCKSSLKHDVTSKEATLQVVYDVLKLTPFYKAFQVTADAPEIYMQEFWASAYIENQNTKEGQCDEPILSFTKFSHHFGHDKDPSLLKETRSIGYAKDDPMFHNNQLSSHKNEDTQLYGLSTNRVNKRGHPHL
ncbi:hypothetical protein Tco_1312347 [Tanacetum coccineum]